MYKIKVHYSTKTKEYYSKTTYHTKTMKIEELPKSNFHEHFKPVDIDELFKIAKKWVNDNNPDTFNKVINISFNTLLKG